MSGADRAMVYRVTAGTGFRAGEIRSLTHQSFQLDRNPPVVVLEAAKSKRRRADVQPIRGDLAKLLLPWLATKPADRPIFADLPEKTAEMIQADLNCARAHWIRETPNPAERRNRQQSDFLGKHDALGRVADFHSLRVSYVTALVRSGANVKVVQELARHSTPTLTMNTYTRLGVHDHAAALDGLPAITPTTPQAEPLQATGTDGGPRLFPHHLGRESERVETTGRDERDSGPLQRFGHKPLSNTNKRESMRRGAGKPPAGHDPATCGLQNRCSTN